MPCHAIPCLTIPYHTLPCHTNAIHDWAPFRLPIFSLSSRVLPSSISSSSCSSIFHLCLLFSSFSSLLFFLSSFFFPHLPGSARLGSAQLICPALAIASILALAPALVLALDPAAAAAGLSFRSCSFSGLHLCLSSFLPVLLP